MQSQAQTIFSREARKQYKDPEIFFFGAIEGGLDFDTSNGLFCEMQLDMGDNWKLAGTKTMKSIVTQTCYADPSTMFVWDHPFEFHFKLKSQEQEYGQDRSKPLEKLPHFFGWPKALLKIWRLDNSNKIDIYAYGTALFPQTKGYHQVVCETWTPQGENLEMATGIPNEDLNQTKGNVRVDRSLDWRYQHQIFFMKNQPRLSSLKPLTPISNQRQILNGITNGKVYLEFEVLPKNFKQFGISYK